MEKLRSFVVRHKVVLSSLAVAAAVIFGALSFTPAGHAARVAACSEFETPICAVSVNVKAAKAYRVAHVPRHIPFGWEIGVVTRIRIFPHKPQWLGIETAGYGQCAAGMDWGNQLDAGCTIYTVNMYAGQVQFVAYDNSYFGDVRIGVGDFIEYDTASADLGIIGGDYRVLVRSAVG